MRFAEPYSWAAPAGPIKAKNLPRCILAVDSNARMRDCNEPNFKPAQTVTLKFRKNLKQITLATGLYGPARRLIRATSPSQRADFIANLRFFGQFISPGDLCFDVGANSGEKTEAMLALGASVVAFEPQPGLVRELSARCAPYGDKYTVVDAAVSDRIGTALLHLREYTQQSSLLSDWEGEPSGEILIKTITLDAAIARYGRPKFCKIDVEGSEPRVLRGLSQRIAVLTMEYHTDDRCVGLVRESIALLQRLGPIRINAIGGEWQSLLFREWYSVDSFLKTFPNNVKPYRYGDLVVQTNPN
jgi:FkbM family methyltransferase